MKNNYDIAAYIWPAYTGDELRSGIFRNEGIGEWQSIKNAVKNSAEYKRIGTKPGSSDGYLKAIKKLFVDE